MLVDWPRDAGFAVRLKLCRRAVDGGHPQLFIRFLFGCHCLRRDGPKNTELRSCSSGGPLEGRSGHRIAVIIRLHCNMHISHAVYLNMPVRHTSGRHQKCEVHLENTQANRPPRNDQA